MENIKTILLVEDDPLLGENVQTHLELANFQVRWAKNLQEAQKFLEEFLPTLTLLDIGLPDGSGLDFCHSLRKLSRTEKLPVIMLTAKTDEETIERAFELGANDYVKKPFNARELLARVKALSGLFQQKSHLLKVGHSALNLETRTFHSLEKEIPLSRREFDLLAYFFQQEEKVLSREKIIEALHYSEEINDRTLDSHISHLRKKLKKSEITDFYIKSEYGVGYRLTKGQ